MSELKDNHNASWSTISSLSETSIGLDESVTDSALMKVEPEAVADEVFLESASKSENIFKTVDETQNEDVSLDNLSIEDKTQNPPCVKSTKINLKQHVDVRKKSASEIDDATKIRRIIPKVNCPEKIVLCIDMSTELEEMSFQLGDGRKYSGFYMAKRVLQIFVHTKHRISKQHEYALVILNENAVLLRNFTSDPRDICNVLEDLHEAQTCDSCDLMSLFQNIYEKVPLPEVPDPSILPPPYLVRCILIYGRSNCIPLLDEESQIMKKLQSSHCFFFDALYIHRQPSNENKCQEVFQALCDIDQNYTSYIFEVSRNPTKLHNYMAMLLAHPMQRPPQNEARYKLKDEEVESLGKEPQENCE